MIAESVAFLVGEGKRVVYDAEHFFDGYRDDPAYAIACLRAAAGGGRRERDDVRHQRRVAAARDRRGASRACGAALRGVALGIHTPQRRRAARVANSLAAVAEGARWCRAR